MTSEMSRSNLVYFSIFCSFPQPSWAYRTKTDTIGGNMAIEEQGIDLLPRDVAPEAQNDEQQELSLRPQRLADFIGQQDLRANLEIFIDAAKHRKEPLEHLLLYGNPGLGKTTLAHIVGREMNTNVRVTSGPALERVGDLAAILSSLQRGDILFIDEIHRINKSIEEVLYPAMEDFALDVVVGKGPTARTLRLSLEPFTIIGATTRLSLLSAPLRDRFGTVFQLDFYQEDDMRKIVSRSASLLGFSLDEACSQAIAQRARRTPRIANRLLKRVRDFAQVKHDGAISPEIANAALDLLAIDPLGLDNADRRVLMTLIEKFQGGPVGLGTLAAATQEEQATIEEVYEPYLLQLGFLERTTRGRIATQRAYEHLGITPRSANTP
jgi:holliday junction DNA helicase RuvB